LERILKGQLTKLLLVLSLLANLMAVFASGLHGTIHQPEQVAAQPTYHVTDQSKESGEAAQHNSTECTMPCCDALNCVEQNTCSLHHYPVLATNHKQGTGPSAKHQNWTALFVSVPDREISPENPPPKYL
jgi:hypothetical protein